MLHWGETVMNQKYCDELTNEESNRAESTTDDTFHILQNKRRRAVIRYLKRREEISATLDELATYIAAQENDVDASQVSSCQRKRVYVSLYQSHLTKMDDFGVIDYDRDRGTITRKDFSRLEPHLSMIGRCEQKPEYATFMFGILVAAGIFSGMGHFGIGPLAFVPEGILVTATIASFLGLAVHSRDRSPAVFAPGHKSGRKPRTREGSGR